MENRGQMRDVFHAGTRLARIHWMDALEGHRLDDAPTAHELGFTQHP